MGSGMRDSRSLSHFKDKSINYYQLNDEKSGESLVGIRTQASRWKAQTNPLSYGGFQSLKSNLFVVGSGTR